MENKKKENNVVKNILSTPDNFGQNNKNVKQKPKKKKEKEQVEETDANSISVDISGEEPIVIFFGPKSIGKTTGLFRLSRYLLNNGYLVTPDKDFRPDSVKYKTTCEDFAELVSNAIAPKGNDPTDFLLLKISNTKGAICQLLEAPGEHYFDDLYPNANFPPYIAQIINNNTPKIYVFFLEIGWGNNIKQRQKYANKIIRAMNMISDNDYIIFLANKADLQDRENTHFFYKSLPVKSSFKKAVENDYKSIFEHIKIKGFFSIFKRYTHRNSFEVFSVGTFNQTKNKEEIHIEDGRDFYPADLWKAIKLGIKGTWL